MRRGDREITDRQRKDELIRRSQVCRVALCNDGQPYIVPMNFGYDHGISTSEVPCNWGTKYQSVVGTGTAEPVETREARHIALRHIMRQYDADALELPQESLDVVFVFRVRIDKVTGKARD